MTAGRLIAGRLIAGRLIDNRPGGSGVVAAQAVPDGYTLLLANTSLLTINAHTFKSLRFDADPMASRASRPGLAGPPVACRRSHSCRRCASSSTGI